ncbi:MAG: DUF3048 domain-containing protein [Patescibacteria group bacterium]
MLKNILIIVLFLFVVGLSSLYYYTLQKRQAFKSPLDKVVSKLKKEENLIENPLNGVLYPKSAEERLLKRRPLVVMIGNNADARPPSNISQADMIYEIVAEGGITRFMSVFLANDPEKIGPVRSIRGYFLNWIYELGDAMVMHDGWSQSPVLEASAIDLIDQIPIRSLFRGGLYGYRDLQREAPNNEYVSARVAREHGDKLGWEGVSSFEKWKFKDDNKKSYELRSKASVVDIIFWTSGDYDSHFDYDPIKNAYLKSTGGVTHKDLENDVQLGAKNVIVQFAKETPVNDQKNHLLYANIGSGKAFVFLDGRVVEATWTKKDRVSRTKFYDLDGKEVEFNRGVIWVSVVPDRNEAWVTYK